MLEEREYAMHIYTHNYTLICTRNAQLANEDEVGGGPSLGGLARHAIGWKLLNRQAGRPKRIKKTPPPADAIGKIVRKVVYMSCNVTRVLLVLSI